MILDLRNGFLMYQVEVRNVSTNVNSSIFPDSSNLSGDVLDWVQALNMKELLIHSLHSEVKIIDDVLHDVLWEHPERHRYFLGKR